MIYRIFSKWWLLLATLFCFCTTDDSRNTDIGRYTVVFYNVENLLDTADDPAVNDNEFLPSGTKIWTTERYNKKLEDISRVLTDAGHGSFPALIGLCEVENRIVLEDLITSDGLRKGKFGLVHKDSPDSRGIDVALLYRTSLFSVTGYSSLTVLLPGRTTPGTRDILYVHGIFNGKDELHIFINHWPSRSAGTDETRADRLAAATVLRNVTDSLFRKDKEVNIIVLGDFNDTPSDQSLKDVLGAGKPDSQQHPGFVNLMFPAAERGEGSYNYQGSFDMLDNLIVSTGLLQPEGLRVENGEGYVFIRDYMTYTNSRGQKVPDRTYVGNRYTGGISDHFPVYFFLKY